METLRRLLAVRPNVGGGGRPAPPCPARLNTAFGCCEHEVRGRAL